MNENTSTSDSSQQGLKPYLTPLAVLALSFGYAVGWGAFVMPGRFFLPVAGPLGSVIGIVAGAAAMCAIAWCYHKMVSQYPGPGGAFTFTEKAFGHDHGFVVAWFLCLAYVAILWANATAFVLLARYTLGDALQFGFHYTLAGFDVYFGEVLLCVAAIALAGGIALLGKKLAANFQTLLAIVFVGGVAVIFAVALARHSGGFASMGPALSPSHKPIVQIIHIFAMAPWALIGFEAITNSSAEFKFPVKKTFSILLASLAVASLVYIALAILPAISIPDGYSKWPDYIAELKSLKGLSGMSVFAAADHALGNLGIALVAASLLSAMFTGIVGTLIANSRLLLAMSNDGLLPEWFGKLNKDSSPRNAIVFITVVSSIIPFFGRTVITWPIDVSSIGATIVYGYVSAAAFKTAQERVTKLVSLAGIVMSICFLVMLLVPNYLFGTLMSTESYLLLAIWCIIGFFAYRTEFRRDIHQRLGHSTVVWISLIVMIFFSSLMWIRQATRDITNEVIENLAREGKSSVFIENEMAKLNSSMLQNSIVEMSLLVVTLAIMLSLFTVLRRREKEMAVAKAEAEEINRSKSYFFSTVSHDIRTPLNAIIGFSQMLKHGFDTKEETDEAVDSILLSSKTLLSLINDVLDLSKLESGRMTIDPEPTDCHALLEDIVKSFRVANKNPEAVEIRGNIDPMPSLLIDPQRVRQIAFNLAGNASKFTKEGYIEIRGKFKRNDDPYTGTLVIEVEDTGCGISEEDLKKIATPYVQVGAKAARNGGTGLGLAICRQLAFAMGGKPRVTSTLGKGSTFSLILPSVEICAPTPSSTQPPAPNAPSSPTLGVSAPEPGNSSPIPHPSAKRILIVDDQRMNLMVLKAMLRKVGDFEITFANNGKEALDILETESPGFFDMVLTDMWMPEMNGEALVKAVRENQFLKNLPVYVLTADVEAQGSYAEVGFTGLLLKPVTIEKLKEVVG